MNTDRASHAFRMGYRDASENRPAKAVVAGTFYGYDYNEGYGAGFNEMYWDAVRENARHGRA